MKKRREALIEPELQQPPQGGKQPRKLKKKNPFRWALLLLLVPAVYIGIQLFIIYMPSMQYQTAIPYSMMDSITVQGFVVMQNESVAGGGEGTLYYTTPVGERVVTGAVVAERYTDEGAAAAKEGVERLNTELNQLDAARKILAEGGDVESLSKQKLAGVYELLNELDLQNYTGLDSSKAGIMLAANKMAVVTGETIDFDGKIAGLTAQKESLQAQATVLGSVTAPASGYFVVSPKYDRVLMDYEPLKNSTPTELQTMLAQDPVYYPQDVIGHIIKDYQWHFFALVPSSQEGKFTPGGKLSLSFSEYDDTVLPVTVQTVTTDDAAGITKVELLCEYINPQVLEMRCEKAEIIFKEEKGLRVDKNALRIVNGENGVYIKYGNMVYFRRIKILQEDEHYLLVSDVKEDGVSELQRYDEVIVDAGGKVLEDEKIL